jgi:hypothetical protein
VALKRSNYFEIHIYSYVLNCHENYLESYNYHIVQDHYQYLILHNREFTSFGNFVGDNILCDNTGCNKNKCIYFNW